MRHQSTGTHWLFVLLVTCNVPLVAGNSLALFGTESGYDRGGKDPVCSVSNLVQKAIGDDNPSGHIRLPVSALEGEGIVPDLEIAGATIEELDHQLMQGNAGDASELLAHCYNGTSLDVSTTRTHYLTNEALKLRLDVEIDTSFIVSDASMTENSTVSFYSRIILCNVVWGGFCTPLSPISETSGSFVTTSPWNVLDDPRTERRSVDHAVLQIPTSLPPGEYLAVGHVVVTFASSTTGEVLRYDMANAIEKRIVRIRAPPVLLETTLGAKLWLGCLIGVCASIALFMLVYLIVQRNEPVLQLAQGNFLSAVTLGCLVQILCSFVFLPTHSIYCGLFGLLILLPMTFVASCLVGRVWRVHKTLFIAQTLGRRNALQSQLPQGKKQAEQVERGLIGFLDLLAKLPCRTCNKNTPIHIRRSLRDTVSDRDTMGLIVMITMPQLFFQVAVLLNGRKLVSIEDEGSEVARMSCDISGRWTTAVGLTYLMIIYILAVSMAWVSRSLPSAFNEKDQIFRTASISTALAFLSMILWKPITDATTTPFFSVLLQATLSISVSMLVLFMIIWPKIQRCRSGEKVVLSNFVSSRFRPQTQPAAYSGASGSNGSFPSSITFDKRSYQSQSSKRTGLDRHSSHLPTIQSGVEEDETEGSLGLGNFQSTRTIVKADDPLPPELETMILGMQGNLREITKKFIQGRAVSPSLLEELRANVNILAGQLEVLDVAEHPEGLPS